MRISESFRFGGVVALGAITAAAFLASESTALAGKNTRVARVGRVDTPLGLQGSRGAGPNVGAIFTLIDATRRKTDVEVQYGVDRNANGEISDDEYRPATEDRLDPRDTRKNKSPQLFSTAGDIGAAHQYVWKSLADIATDRLLTLEYDLTPQGREVPDPDNPGSFVFATGPGGTPLLAGVRLRVRAVRTGSKKQGAGVGDWVVSQSFGVNNNNPPSATIDSVESNGNSVPTASDEVVLVHWTVSDPDSEDLNGNGVLDVADGEDANGNGQLDAERVGVAFDYHRVLPGENPATMTPDQLAALAWLPCTRKKGVGDTDSLDVSPGLPIPESGDDAGLPSAPGGVGRHWVFAWNSVEDVGTIYAKFILRARPFDQKRETGTWTYQTTPFQLDNWRIFNPGSTGFPVAPLASGRVGHTVTNIRSAVDPGDILDRGELFGFQSVLVAGGSTSVSGGGVAGLDLMLVNTVTAETTTSARVALALLTARVHHTATALDDGRILFIGGFDATGTVPLATTEVYDPKTRALVPGPTLAHARARHAAVKLTGGEIAVFGGVGAGGAALGSCEMIRVQPYADQFGVTLDPATTWSVVDLPSLATPQHSPVAAVLPDQTVLVTGGIDGGGAGVRSAELLNPLNDNDLSTPTTKDPVFVAVASQMKETRKSGAATPLIDGNVLFTGGTGSPAKASMEIFNWQNRMFETVNLSLEFPRAQHEAVRLGDGSVLVMGGTDDPDVATPSVVADADVVKIGARDALTGTWAATLQSLNGDIAHARRLSRATAIPNGRVLLVAGADATGALSSCETFTPVNGINTVPVARISLPSSQLSWLYGAPIYYRLTDLDQDRARVEVQFIDRTPAGDRVWHACSPLATTIGGDVADATADLATTLTDDTSLAIDPVVHNTPGDHSYIWALQRDIVRPAVGLTANSYNIRVIPTGAVIGTSSESDPIEVLNNTKVVPTILPFENVSAGRPDVALPAGAPTPNQGGDIKIWVHLRDLDGGPGNAGDPATLLYLYAIDANNDGQIKDSDREFYVPMTASGARVGHPSSANPQTNLTTYFESAQNSDPAFGARPASKGWTSFTWDSLRDIGAPPTTYSNIFIQIVPTDTNAGLVTQGFIRFVRNVAGQPPVFTVIRHPDSLFLKSWKPRYSNSKTAMPVNDPIDFTFNGLIEPASLTNTSLQIFRGTGIATSQVRGVMQLTNNAAANEATVTFFPEPLNLNNGVPTIGQGDASTVLYPNDDYSIRIPGYRPDPDPLGDPTAEPVPTNPVGVPVTMLRPLGQTVAGGQYSTYRLVQLVPLNAGSLLNDPLYKIHTAAAGVYADDGAPVTMTMASVPSGTTNVVRTPTTLAWSFNQAMDTSTTKSPNLTATIGLPGGMTSGGGRTTISVVPGNWTVVNTPTPGQPGQVTSVMTFVPLFQLPPLSVLQIQWNSGLKAANGRSPAPGNFLYTIETYTRVTTPNPVVLENFSTQTFEDTSIPAATRALWGTEPCAPQALSGGATGGGPLPDPTGVDGALLVAYNTTTTIPQATRNYTTITVQKGGTLVLDSQTGPVTLTATGNITVDGTIKFAGADGYNGLHARTDLTICYGGPAIPGTRIGGAGRNGGGSGGASVSTGNTLYRDQGSDGVDGMLTASTFAVGTKGRGGNMPTETGSAVLSRYLYGCGGGAGGGNGTAGLAGGRPTNLSAYSVSLGYGAASTPGSPGGDAFMTTGVPGGGGGGGGSSSQWQNTIVAYGEGGAGGAGAGSLTLVTNTNFNLSATGLINGRGGFGGTSNHGSGSGGGGAGGSVKIIAKVKATLDGVIDLRGGQGGAKGFAQVDTYMASSSVVSEYPCRYGGDGAPGRLLVLAPNFADTDEVRVYGQFMQRKIGVTPGAPATLPTTALALNNVAQPAVLANGAASATATFTAAQTDVHWSTLTVAAGVIATLNSTSTNLTTLTQSTPLRIFVDGQVTINGTLRLNGDTCSQNNPAGYVQNLGLRTSNYNILGATWAANSTLNAGRGFAGNLGGGDGGDGYTLSAVAYGTEASDGGGPPPLVAGNISPKGTHNALATTGATVSSWVNYQGDSGGNGGANATDGDEGWAPYAITAAYNYLGSTQSQSTAIGVASRSGKIPSIAPVRLGGLATATGVSTNNDPSTITAATVGNFAGAGGGGGGASACSSYSYFGMAGQGGGGGGGLAIISKTNITVGDTGVVEARGGDGQAPGITGLWYSYAYGHAAGGGGSGGTVYLAADTITINKVTDTTNGLGGATFDLRGGLGGGRRSTSIPSLNPYPEYASVGSFGGTGGYGRLVVDYVTSLNTNRQVANRWGMQQTVIDANNTFKALAGTSFFFCPGIGGGGTRARSTWYDLNSIQPIVTAFSAGTVKFANNYSTQIEGAQSHPHNKGANNVGEADPTNTSILGLPSGNPILSGWRWFRFETNFTRASSSTGPPVQIDDMTITYTRDK